MPKVLVSPATLNQVHGSHIDALVKAGLEPVYNGLGRQMVEEDLLVHLKGITACVAGSEPYTQRVFQAHPQLRVVARVGVGYDAVDLDAATANGVAVTFAPNTNHGSVAEHTFALMLALTKRLISQHEGVRTGKWPRGTNLPMRSKTLGIAGLGRIGKAVATRARAFGMRLLAYEPFPDQAFIKAQEIELVSFEELLKQSDFLTLHLPMSEESRHLMNHKTLALMKPSAFLINTSRGGVICEADLEVALREKRIAGAGLDVFEEEPPLETNPLLKLDSVVLTPHAAGVDVLSIAEMALSAAEAVVSLSRGEWPEEKVVNPKVRSRFRW